MAVSGDVENLKKETYGSVISANEAINKEDFLSILASNDTANVKLAGIVTEVCRAKGCWMKVDLGDGELIRVTFKDYSFFVPINVAGKKVEFEGMGIQKYASVDQLKHYAKDGGKSAVEIEKINQAKREVTFIAQGVSIIN